MAEKTGPQIVDTALAAAHTTAMQQAQRIRSYRKTLDSFDNEYDRKYYQERLDEAEGKLAQAQAQIDWLGSLYTGWARYYVCQHIHTHRCSGLKYNSVLSWVPELAGKTVDEMIQEHGHNVCTICVPDAPCHPAYVASEKAKAEKDAAETCPGSGQHVGFPTGRSARARWARCPSCGKGMARTQNGCLRKHKA